MGVAGRLVHVMRPTTPQRTTHTHDPTLDDSVVETLAWTSLFAAVPLAVMLAVTYPMAAVSVTALAVVARPTVGSLRQLREDRRTDGRARQVCVPGTGVCVEA